MMPQHNLQLFSVNHVQNLKHKVLFCESEMDEVCCVIDGEGREVNRTKPNLGSNNSCAPKGLFKQDFFHSYFILFSSCPCSCLLIYMQHMERLQSGNY